MELLRHDQGSMCLTLSEKELLTLRAAIRECFAAIGREEFRLRLGVDFDIAAATARELTSLLQREGIDD